MAVRAQAKYVRVAPRKAREVVDLIRGKSVAEARSTLFFANRNAARVVARVLNSAVANAESAHALDGDDARYLHDDPGDLCGGSCRRHIGERLDGTAAEPPAGDADEHRDQERCGRVGPGQAIPHADEADEHGDR